jgi:septal ring factor EnvC (AmiA/AmiB activator)
MKSRNRFNAKQLVARMALGVLIVTSSLVFAGCSKQFSRIEENQLKLQALVQTNAQQLAGSVAAIEENQSKVQAAIKDLQARTVETAAGVAEVRQEQIQFSETLQKNNEQMASSISRLEQDQLEFATKMLTHIGTIADLAGNISTVQQGRLEHEKKMLADIRAIADAVNAIEQTQSKLQGQMGEVQNGTEVLRKGMVAFLEQLGAKLSEISAQISSAGTPKDQPSAQEPNEAGPNQ